ncbi:MAG: alpha/beta hydrolase [Pseudonocardiales bacterium]
MEQIRANSILPAVRRRVTLHTADGLELVGELALPVDEAPAATVVCCHPLPTHGGSMDSHLLRKAARRLPALAGIAVVRFNTRGTRSAEGQSQGVYDKGDGERYDIAAALDLVESEDLPAPWLLGWSFGSELVLKYGALDPSIVGGFLISPPLKRSTDQDLDAWAASARPLVAVVPEHDDYLQPEEARRRFARVPQCRVVAIAGAKHLLVGFAEEVFDVLAETLLPGIGALAREYEGILTAPPPWG